MASMTPSIRGLNFKATREGWQSRPRQGQGGGKEYAYASLPAGVQAALALRWWATEVQRTRAHAKSQGRHILSHSARLGELCPAKNPQQSQGTAAHGCIDGTADPAGKWANPQPSDCCPASPGAGHNRSTVFRWLKCVHGVPQPHWLPFLGSKFTGGKQPAHCPPEIWDFFISDYLRLEQPAASACYRRAQQLAAKLGHHPSTPLPAALNSGFPRK